MTDAHNGNKAELERLRAKRDAAWSEYRALHPHTEAARLKFRQYQRANDAYEQLRHYCKIANQLTRRICL